jgi:predicted amidohydrolase
MRSLVIAVAQPHVKPLDVAANALTHADTVHAAAARVVVFPELSLTGYELDAPPLDPADARLAPLVEACASTNTVALVGAPVAGPHIAFLKVDERGVEVVYRKQNLHGAEIDSFLPGPAPAVLDVDGWRLGLAICRDTGIEAHAAATAALGIDAYVAGSVNLPEDERESARRAVLTATTHRVWVAFAENAGVAGATYPRSLGRSGIWAPDGTIAARASHAAGEIARATLVGTLATA